MDEEAAFTATIVAAPRDDTCRLVFADWLDERDDSRAAFIRLECELARLDPMDPRYADVLHCLLAAAREADPSWVRQVSRVPIPPVECRLRYVPYPEDHPSYPRPAPTRGEVELVNTSGTEVVIEYDCRPLQYLDLLVTDSAGRVRSTGYYGSIFSAFGGVEALRLGPGESFRYTVGLLSRVPRPSEAVGTPSGRALLTTSGAPSRAWWRSTPQRCRGDRSSQDRLDDSSRQRIT